MKGKSIRYALFALIILLAAGLDGLVKAQSAEVPEKGNSDIISLKGIWGFELDPLDEGNHDRGNWYTKKLPDTITLPGSTDKAGRGYKTHDLVPWRLNRLFKYKGAAWYSKKVYVPENWNGKDIQLYLERTHWSTIIWVNGQKVGREVSLSVPHVYDITHYIKPGAKNLIMIRVDNDYLYNVGFYSSGYTEETQTNWNGIIGKIQLQARDKVYLSDVQVYPDVSNKTAEVKLKVVNRDKQAVEGTVHFSAASYNTDHSQDIASQSVSFSGSDSLIVVDKRIRMGENVQLWDEFHPVLYRLSAKMSAGSGESNYEDSTATSFGMRDFATKGTQFVINGKPTFIRGTLNCAPFPINGYPPTDVAHWKRIFKICKEYGQNSMRFHSWCPPEAAFEAADQLGFYLQVANPYWDPRTCGSDSATNAFITHEADRILNAYGNHPSFTMFVTGNELGGPNVVPFLTKLVKRWKKEDPRHLYCSASGYALIPENDYDNAYGARAQLWAQGLKGRFNKEPLSTDMDYTSFVKKYPVPYVSHEVGQWCVYPNFEEIPKYTGVLRAYNFELFRKSLQKHHMMDQAHQFLMASGKLQVLEYKEEVEAALRTPDFGGYQLLGLHDFPGQGTALVGVLDAFWDPKPYVDGKEFHEFQSAHVPLLRTGSFTWTTNQTFKGIAEFANYGENDLTNAVMHWSLKYPDGTVFAEGNFNGTDLPVGQPTKVGDLSVPLNKIDKATRLRVTLSIRGTDYTNHWDIWIYPEKVEMPRLHGITVVHEWNSRVKRILDRGGKVLLLADTSAVKSNIPPGFSGIFWNTNWTEGQAPHTLGILCNPKNPVLADFPTQYYSNWQWWDLVDHSKPMVMDQMPGNLTPTVQMIDDWNKNHKIGLVFEAKVGKGKLLMTSIDLQHDLDHRPVARQMLYSLEKYVNSDRFDPKVSVTARMIDQLF